MPERKSSVLATLVKSSLVKSPSITTIYISFVSSLVWSYVRYIHVNCDSQSLNMKIYLLFGSKLVAGFKLSPMCQQALPYVTLLIMLMFFMYAVIGMQVS